VLPPYFILLNLYFLEWFHQNITFFTHMGFAISWCAVPESAIDGFLQRAGLVETGETGKMMESLIGLARLDTGWRVLWYNRYGCPFLSKTERQRHSQHHDIIYCMVEEHCMTCSAELWSKGARKWWISHEGENGPKGLDFDGSPPENFESIKFEMETAQVKEGGMSAGVDYIFEIPLLVAKSIVGFKHDEVCPHVIGGKFNVLKKKGRHGNFLFNLFRKK
jgi:hypothetical protein